MPRTQKKNRSSADELLQRFKIKVTGNIVWAGGITELVLSIAQFWLGNHGQAVIILTAGIFFTATAWFYQGRRIPVALRSVFIILLTVICAMSIYINGHIGVYWTYPLIVACLFMFSGMTGVAATVALTVIFSATAFISMPIENAWRITATLTIISVLGAVFVVLLAQLQKLLRQLVVTDTLTGLQNRHLVTGVLEQAIYSRSRYGRSASIIMADLDHFKKLNDAHGHLFGDQILKQVADRLKAALRQEDQLFRVGGEEFLIVLPSTELENAVLVAEKLRALIHDSAFDGKTASVHVTLSLGVAELSAKQTWTEWLNAADTALLEAKRKGRNQVRKATKVVPAEGMQTS